MSTGLQQAIAFKNNRPDFLKIRVVGALEKRKRIINRQRKPLLIVEYSPLNNPLNFNFPNIKYKKIGTYR